MPGPKTRALLWCVALLVVAEAGTRRLATLAASERTLDVDGALALCLGSSRTMRAIDPRIVERDLRGDGAGEVFAASVVQKGVTAVGLHRLYMEKIHPYVEGGRHTGVVAIELYGAGLNDNRLRTDERRWAASGRVPRTPWAALRAGDPAAAAQLLLDLLRLVRLGEVIDDVRATVGHDAPPWAVGDRGFVPFAKPRWPDLKASYWREQYTEKLLVDYEVGGVQADALRAIARQVRADGLVPVFYVLPITELHRTLYRRHQWRAWTGLIHEIAASEDVRLVDLDTDHKIPLLKFQDTNHIAPIGVPAVSERVARRVFRPVLLAGVDGYGGDDDEP